MSQHQRIAVIGAGLMGHGIALSFARAGHAVKLFDPNNEMLESAPQRITDSLRLLGDAVTDIESAMSRIHYCNALADGVGSTQWVFEAAPEKLELKQSIFAEVEQHAPHDAVFASNTSVIPITRIMSQLHAPHRALGTHWWNPPHMIPLVEVIKTDTTDDAVAASTQALLNGIGKTAVLVEKDVPGFIGNRLQHALWREAISLVENGVCSAKAVDDVVKASFGRRMAVLGPLENADLVGLALTQDIHNQVLSDLDNASVASPYLQTLIDKGHTGMGAGAGLRTWQDGDVEATKARIAKHLKELSAILPN